MCFSINVMRSVVKSVLTDSFQGIGIYDDEEVSEETEKPFIFVSLSKMNQRLKAKEQFLREFYFELFISAETFEQMYDLADQLFEKLNYLVVDDNFIRGKDIVLSSEENQLKFSIRYDVNFTSHTSEEVLMQKLVQSRAVN